MIFYFILNIFIYIFIIYICHEIWNYIKNTYSTKKTKDLVNIQIQKYKKMMKEIQDNNSDQNINNTFLNYNEKDLMDKQLTEFVNNIH